jgi:pimeloyl-ACP methyl ester carboxylesterase
MLRFASVCALVLLAAHLAPAAPPAAGYTQKVSVGAPTRLDWTFVVSNQSLADPPAKLAGADYDPKKQSYDLYLPDRKDVKKPLPAIVWVSASDNATGWNVFEKLCKDKGIAYIGIREAGNGVPPPKRVRIVLDCLDDVRRQVPLDPDRTYIGGFSGGARMASAVAFALPEYFGGVIPVCAAGDLREEPWLRHRITDRLSAALVTGADDFNRGEVERWKGTMWPGIGVRTKVWVEPDYGHSMPPAATFAAVLKWLDDDAPRRAALAKKYPTTRATPDGALTREQGAKAIFDEGKALLSDKATMHRGLMLLKGAAARWPDLTSGKAALKLLTEYDAKKDRPWEEDDLAEQRKQIAAEARGLGEYALRGIAPGSQYEKQKPTIAKRAIELWGVLIQDAPNSDLGKEGKKWVADLEPLTKKK